MKINCLSCGHNVELDDIYADHYEGEIKCYACGALLEIRTEDHALRQVHLMSRLAGGAAGQSVAGHNERSESAPAGGFQHQKAREETHHARTSGTGGDAAHEPASRRSA